MEITSGRNKSRSGVAEQPAEEGQILRLIREGAVVRSEQQGQEAPLPAGSNPLVVVKAKAKPNKRKLVPREVVPEYVGPPLTRSQELSRLFATKPAERPPMSQE
eukprot:876885-Heterocapsa_arctica.AAC.1